MLKLLMMAVCCLGVVVVDIIKCAQGETPSISAPLAAVLSLVDSDFQQYCCIKWHDSIQSQIY